MLYLTYGGVSESVLLLKFRTLYLLMFERENPRRVEWLLPPNKEVEGYPVVRHLKYCAARSRKQKVRSVAACARLDGKEWHENVAGSDS
jgi:hypothetical protein